ncbi:sensor histidine kinase [Nocardioides sediminis]|uniref:sensor histidine kinase n=1 Tax=Nocardioides sediminis TaxID=433648 RepID=UPI00131EE5C6|nr:histidine kinase [Nocardioides sediminis]
MRSRAHAEGGAKAPSLTPWRVTTAARAFALALVVGTLLGEESATESAPLLAALVVIAAVSSALEWNAPAHSRPWIPVGEAFLVAVLLASGPLQPSLLLYVAIPPIVAGVRHGWVTTVNAGFVTGVTTICTLTVMPDSGATRERILEAAPWIVTGIGVGLLASWQSRSMRDLETRQAPFAAANQLVSQLHGMASRGTVGLDSAQLAAELETALRTETGATRSAVFIHGPSPQPELLSSHAGDDLMPTAPGSHASPDPAVLTVWLHGGAHRLGSAVLVRDAGWTDELRARARTVADEFVLRLDTALLFDDVRLMATAEERNRIAREMHDGVAQEVVALGYIVDEIESASDQPETRELAATLRAEISRVVTELRFSIFDLRHQVTDHRLSGALAEYVREVSHGTDLRVHLLLDESGPVLSSRMESELLRVAQEGINNVRRHARARNLWVTLVSDGSCVRLEIEDDGIGNALPKDRHWGLQTMRERADAIGADLDISPRDDGGTVVRLQTRQPTLTEGKRSHEHHSPAR